MPTTAESNRLRFTKTALLALDPPTDADRTYYYDDHPGAPQGFALCVTRRGLKRFYLVGRVNGRPKREDIGIFAKPGHTGGGLTVEQARDKAVGIVADRNKGVDTFAKSQAERRQMTFGEAFDAFITAPTPRRKRPKSAKTVTEYKCQKDKYLADWLGLRLSDITRGMVRKLHNRIAADLKKPVMANRTVGLVRSVFNHAIKVEDVDVANPAMGFERSEEHARDRRLSADELPRFWEAVDADERAVAADALRLAIYSGQRIGNVLSARWEDIDMKAKTWTIAEGRTKTRREYVVHLAPQVLAILSRRKLKAEEHPYVFPGRLADRHLTSLRYIMDDVTDTAKIKDLVIHDLRRTAESIAGDTGMPQKYVDLITKHETGTGMARVYNRPDAAIARKAFAILADAIDATVAGEPLPQWATYGEEDKPKKKGAKRG